MVSKKIDNGQLACNNPVNSYITVVLATLTSIRG